jgi:lipid II:glycine glycyltransferase (peptidoglycan interpeptide bridge formation enzyme)
VRQEPDAQRWDDAVLSLPTNHVLQSAAWGGLKERWGWLQERLLWERDGRPVAAALLLHRRVGSLPIRVGYVPKGPLVSQADTTAWQQVLTDLSRLSRSLGLAQLKIDPDVPSDTEPVARQWRVLGWAPSAEQIQFPNTMVSDLTPGEDELLARMKSKTRYNIGLASRRDVVVRRGDESDLTAFFELYRETALRDGFGIRVPQYYRDAWSQFLRRGTSALILAERRGELLAGVLPVAFGSTAYFLYGASATLGREHMASYAAQWESLRWAKSHGCLTYDWWGGPTTLDESDALWGVYRYKLGFGAQLEKHLGAYDLAVRPLAGAVYRQLTRARYWALAARKWRH